MTAPETDDEPTAVKHPRRCGGEVRARSQPAAKRLDTMSGALAVRGRPPGVARDQRGVIDVDQS
jgi:hypothetical protein